MREWGSVLRFPGAPAARRTAAADAAERIAVDYEPLAAVVDAAAALNPGAKLPNDAISVVYRSDGSGTSFLFTTYLAGQNADWAAKVGANDAVNWPSSSESTDTVPLPGWAKDSSTGKVTSRP